jgi:dTDP-4-dehydrorhamnose reductase
MRQISTKDGDNRTRASIVIGSSSLIGCSLMDSISAQRENVWGSIKNLTSADEKTFRLDLSEDNIAQQLDIDFIKTLNGQSLTCFMCAAISRFNDCVQNPELSYTVNVRNTLEVAKFFLQKGSTFVFLSSNAVFDGTRPYCTEDYPTSPVSVYGRQKVLVEEGLVQIQQQYKGTVKIMRLTKVLSKTLPLINEWIERLKTNQPIYPYDNLIFSPVSLKYVVQALRYIDLHSGNKYPILHITGAQDITYYNFALKLAKYLEVNLNLVQKNHLKLELEPTTHAPLYSALGMSIDNPGFESGAQSIDSVIQDLFDEDDNESSVSR